MSDVHRKAIVILGAGDHARVIADTILLQKEEYDFLGFIDPFTTQDMVMGFPVFKALENVLEKINDRDIFGITGVGANYIREKIVRETENFNNKRFDWESVIHPSAIISTRCAVGQGCFVNAGCIINIGAALKSHVSLNTGTIIEHDCTIEAFASTGPNVAMGGRSYLGKRSYLGLGAHITHGRHIADDCIIGAGSVLTKDCAKELEVWYGAPAKRIRSRQVNDIYL
jgi:sugar O-acyltransferase (sialic acid O-acetyltransferase NeuD family)